MTAHPDLSVIVVTHNGRAMALQTLRSARDAVGAIRVQWLVVDSGSDDGTAEAIEAAWPDIRVVRLDNVGFAAANNAALPHAGGRYVLLLNPDVEISRGTFEDLIAQLDDRPEVGAASVTQLGPGGQNRLAIRRFPSPARKLGEALALGRWKPLRSLQESDAQFEHYEREWAADWLVGAFLVVRREAIAQVGLLDEQFFLYAEEKDWCYRLRKAGWDVRHLTAMTVVHFLSARRPELVAQLSHSNVLFARKHFTRRRAVGVQLAIALGHALRTILILPAACARPTMRARWRAERLGLMVTLGISPPPFKRESQSASARSISRS